MDKVCKGLLHAIFISMPLMVASWNTSWNCLMEFAVMEYIMVCVMGCLMVSKYGVTAGCPIQAVQHCLAAKDTTISPDYVCISIRRDVPFRAQSNTVYL